MLFNSYIFILLFLPLCLIGYYGINKTGKYKLGLLFLFFMSLWFYGYYNVSYLFIILGSIAVNYGVYRLLLRAKQGTKKKILMIFGVLVNVGILFYFKYMDFFIENINKVFDANHHLLGIALPLGISFFTFQQISFIVDTYGGEIKKYDLLNYACFVTFFPQLIAGPIVKHDELIPQFLDETKKTVNWDNVAKGVYIFTLGLAKKVLLADIFGNAVNAGYANLASLDTTNALIVMFGYTFQIYFDFSGYCDMAIGLGKMLNIDLPLNFNSPYKALTITEFWDRWHMTLTRFLTQYVYIPLGGNRKGKVRTYVNILIVFLVSGFWHGASWNFVFWGFCHGVFIVITKRFKGFFDKLHPALNWMITFGFVNVMWVFFRADNFTDAFLVLKRIVSLQFGPINKEIFICFSQAEFEAVMSVASLDATIESCLLLGAYFLVALCIVLGAKNSYEKMKENKFSVKNALVISILAVWSVASLSNVSTFLYFNF